MRSILAVDDSASMRKMVSFTLTGAGFHVVEAVDGQDAWDKAQNHSIDLVLTDQNMPNLDGLGLTRKLRGHPKFQRCDEAGWPRRGRHRLAGQTLRSGSPDRSHQQGDPLTRRPSIPPGATTWAT
jgi:CheY-like chemotaxis protein